jgi:octaprenyl-diphosphate synthase
MTLSSLAEIGERVDKALIHALAEEVAEVERELTEQMKSSSKLVEQVGRHTLRAGGKRLRPAFVLVGARATGLPFSAETTRRIGVSMEMIHMATLIHDDVIDNSAMRRGLPTAAAVFGNRASILSGDALLAKATSLLTHVGDIRIIQIVSEAVSDMAVGEVREVEERGNFFLDEPTHLEILQLKTASFIQACCECGGYVAKADLSILGALRTFGRHVGLAFQLVDDLLDYRGDRNKTGKPIATDFMEGQATLPLIYLRESLSDTESDFVQSLFRGQPSEDDIRLIVGWMEERGCFNRCEERAREHVRLAMDAAGRLPSAPAKQLLSAVAEYVLGRQL